MMTTPEKAKMHAASFFRQNARIREPAAVDEIVTLGYAKLHHLSVGDIFEGSIHDFLTPKVARWTDFGRGKQSIATRRVIAI